MGVIICDPSAGLPSSESLRTSGSAGALLRAIAAFGAAAVTPKAESTDANAVANFLRVSRLESMSSSCPGRRILLRQCKTEDVASGGDHDELPVTDRISHR